MKAFIVASLLIVLPGVCSGSSPTSSFQCSRGIVSINDTKEEVITKCGSPNGKTYTEVTPIAGSDAYKDRRSYTYESEWIYNPGSTGFVYILEMRNGKVQRIINTEKYGSE